MSETEGVTYFLRPEQVEPDTCKHLAAFALSNGETICSECGRQLREPVDVRALEDRVTALEEAVRQMEDRDETS